MTVYSIQPKGGGAAPPVVIPPPELIQALIGEEGEPFVGNQDGYACPSTSNGTALGFGIYQNINILSGGNFRNTDPDGEFWRFSNNGTVNNRCGLYLSDSGTGAPYPFTLNRVHRMENDFAALIKWNLVDQFAVGRLCVGWALSGQAAVNADNPGSEYIGVQFSGPNGRNDPTLMWMGHDGTSQTVLASTGILPATFGLTRYLRLFVKSGGTAATLEILNADGSIALSRPFVLAELPGTTVSLIPTYLRNSIVIGSAQSGHFYYMRGCNRV